MMKLIEGLFKDVIYKKLVIYLDDIIIASDTYKENMEIIRTVLQRLRENHFILNKEKYNFLSDDIEILGYRITKQGMTADPAKLGKVIDIKIPQNRKQLQAFIGIINYLGKFYPYLATAAPPTDL